MRARNKGFALVVTLWALVGASALVLTATGTARDALDSARNRSNSDRAYWAAFGCLERAQYAAYAALWPDGVTPDAILRGWRNLDAVIAARLRSLPCEMTLTPAGLTANVNAIAAPELHRLMIATGMSGRTADSLTDAILDWRDVDDTPRPFGAEREWYVRAGLVAPRNAPYADRDELRFVRGFARHPPLQPLLDVEADRVWWTRAPAPVLASLPGMTAEALGVLFSRGHSQVDELALIGSFPELPAYARDSLAHYAPPLLRSTTSLPDAWVLRATARAGAPAIAVSIDMRVALGERRLIVLQRVTRP